MAGILFLVVGFLNIDEDEEQQRRADKVNNTATIVVFIISFMNIVMGAFGFETSVVSELK